MTAAIIITGAGIAAALFGAFGLDAIVRWVRRRWLA